VDRWVIALILLIVAGAIMYDGTASTREANTLVTTQDDSFANAEPVKQPDDWRRTANGWERVSRWEQERLRDSPPPRTIHPTLVGAFCVLASIGALVAFSRRTTTRAPSKLGG